MPIVKQYGPSSVSYGDVVYRSAQNQERYRRATENLGTNAAANADAKYKLGMLALEKERFEFEKPLAQKASDLKEVEAWLAKSGSYTLAFYADAYRASTVVTVDDLHATYRVDLVTRRDGSAE